MQNNLKFEILSLFVKIIFNRILNQIIGLSYYEDPNLYSKLESENFWDYKQLLKTIDSLKTNNLSSHTRKLIRKLEKISKIENDIKNEDFDYKKLKDLCDWSYEKYEFLAKEYMIFLAKKFKIQDYAQLSLKKLSSPFWALIKTNLFLENKWEYNYLTKRSLQTSEIESIVDYQLRKSTKIFYCDFDDFGLFNKLFWHSNWDKVIEKFVQILNKKFCWTQTWYRYWWEEFVWICDKNLDLEDIKSFFVYFDNPEIIKLFEHFLTLPKNQFFDLGKIQQQLKVDILPTNWSTMVWRKDQIMIASTRRYAPSYQISDLRPVRWKIKKTSKWRWVEIYVSLWETKLDKVENIFEKIEKAEKIAIKNKRNEVLEIENSNWWEKIKNF